MFQLGLKEQTFAKWGDLWSEGVLCSLLTWQPWKVLLSLFCVSEDPLFLPTKTITFMFLQLTLEQRRFGWRISTYRRGFLSWPVHFKPTLFKGHQTLICQVGNRVHGEFTGEPGQSAPLTLVCRSGVSCVISTFVRLAFCPMKWVDKRMQLESSLCTRSHCQWHHRRNYCSS